MKGPAVLGQQKMVIERNGSEGGGYLSHGRGAIPKCVISGRGRKTSIKSKREIGGRVFLKGNNRSHGKPSHISVKGRHHFLNGKKGMKKGNIELIASEKRKRAAWGKEKKQWKREDY